MSSKDLNVVPDQSVLEELANITDNPEDIVLSKSGEVIPETKNTGSVRNPDDIVSVEISQIHKNPQESVDFGLESHNVSMKLSGDVHVESIQTKPELAIPPKVEIPPERESPDKVVAANTEEEIKEKNKVLEEVPSVEMEKLAEKDSVREAAIEDFEKLFKSGESSVITQYIELEVQQKKVAEVTKPKKKKKKKQKKSKSDADEDYLSIFSAVGSREQLIVGDFSNVERKKSPSLPSIDEEDEEEEEEEEEEVDKNQIVVEGTLSEFERYQLYAEYDKLIKEYDEVKVKNNYLLKKLVNFYRRRKMFHVLYEGKVAPDTIKKYEKQLDDFHRLKNLNEEALKNIDQELSELQAKCNTKENDIKSCFENFQQKESEVGKELLSSKAERGPEEKYIERYLKRQRIQLENLIKIRLDYIKTRNKINEIQEALDAIDNFGPNLHLIDYEQLKVDHRNLQDKLEEKDVELRKSRFKCQHSSQVLAHRREKAVSLDVDIEYLEERLEAVTGEFEDVREQVNLLKQEKDYYRSSIIRIKEQSGLLSKPKLLVDMSNTIRQSEIFEEEVERIRQEYYTVVENVEKLRKNMASPAKLKRIKSIMEANDDVSVGTFTVETQTSMFTGEDINSELTVDQEDS